MQISPLGLMKVFSIQFNSIQVTAVKLQAACSSGITFTMLLLFCVCIFIPRTCVLHTCVGCWDLGLVFLFST